MSEFINSVFDNKIQSLIDSATTATSDNDLLLIAVSVDKNSFDRNLTVSTASSLPSLSSGSYPDGTMFFVNDLNIHLVSNNKCWISVDGRVWRNDSPTTTVWSMGFNTYGRLGDNTIVSKSSPVSVVGGFTDWCQISAGNSHTAAVRTNGTLWAWGYNGSGRLGDNTIVAKSSPVSVVGGFTDWCQVSAGVGHTAAVRTNGTLWAWGFNNSGRLGDNTIVNKSSPVSVVGGFTNWCQVSTGYSHTAAVRINGTIWTWGYNSSGQLGDNTIVAKSSPVSVVGGFTDWCQVSAGQYHTAAVRTNGTLWTWGCNSYGQLGDSTTIHKSSPVSIVGGFTDWCQVSVGTIHTAAVRTNGTLWTWGFNSCGRLGDNTTVSKSSPVSVVGGFTDWCQVSADVGHTAAVRTNGTLWAWGYNGSGRLGDNTTITKSSPVSVVGGFTDWCQVSAGCAHTAAFRATNI